MSSWQTRFVPSLVCAGLLLTPASVDAYVGPGAGISVIGTAIAFVGALVFAILGFVWYPLKRLVAAFKGKTSRDGGPNVT